VTLLVNNAGVSSGRRLIGAPDLTGARDEIEVNYFGLLRMCRAFAPVLATNGGGTIINMLSILSRVAAPGIGSYSAAKAAAFSLTQSVRAELHRQGTQVIGVMPAYVETDMTARLQAPKIQPVEVVRAALAAVGTDQEDVYPGDPATQVAAQLLQDPKALERSFAQGIAD
jgi:NAD(P)-dependent dehydrogenase (short-subunit alcohol dehydrogenase family)